MQEDYKTLVQIADQVKALLASSPNLCMECDVALLTELLALRESKKIDLASKIAKPRNDAIKEYDKEFRKRIELEYEIDVENMGVMTQKKRGYNSEK